jgi:hypothetical protein
MSGRDGVRLLWWSAVCAIAFATLAPVGAWIMFRLGEALFR